VIIRFINNNGTLVGFRKKLGKSWLIKSGYGINAKGLKLMKITACQKRVLQV
jgi:hypothetical protein